MTSIPRSTPGGAAAPIVRYALLAKHPERSGGRATATRLKGPGASGLALARRLEAACPSLQGRALRGAAIVADNAITPSQLNPVWFVGSQTDPAVNYRIERDPTGELAWDCTCTDSARAYDNDAGGAPWIHHNGKRTPTCKHICAVIIFERTGLAHPQWPPACPVCELPMHVKRRTADRSGMPFWSCSNFPNCIGDRPFAAHPDDLAQANGDQREALMLSLERAQRENLVAVAIGAQRRARRRRIEDTRADAYRRMVAGGESPDLAAATTDATFMPFEEWRRHGHG